MTTPYRTPVFAARASLAIAAAALLLGTDALAQQRDHNEVIQVPDDDRAMAQAIAKAQSTLDDFLAAWKAQAPGTSDFRLKVQVKDGALSEHFWVMPFRPTAKGFEGVLANEPRIVKNVKNGQAIAFTRAQISDWGYVHNGRQVGSFTICAMFKHAPKDQVDYYQKNYRFDCKP